MRMDLEKLTSIDMNFALANIAKDGDFRGHHVHNQVCIFICFFLHSAVARIKSVHD